MGEKLEVFGEDDVLLGIEEREKFYADIKKEFAQTGRITKKVKNVRLLLMNSEGRIYLQERSRRKQENPGLYDKTIGGHVAAGDTFDMTLIRECAEELGFPAAVLPSEDFENAVERTDKTIIGLFRKIDYDANFLSVRITPEGDEFTQPIMNAFYVGYYDGAIRFADGESSGIKVLSLEELQESLERQPEIFTQDIRYMVEKYGRFLVPLQ